MRKRVFDAVVGTALAVAALPVVAVLAMAVALSLRTTPFFLQPRVGRNGRVFTCIKLRTLPKETATDASKYDLADVRVTTLGRFLRATHLDELPQLLLVPFGLMSLVGPRPEMPRLLATFDPEFVSARQGVRPGCTGLWQVSEAAGRLIGEETKYDLHYVRNVGLKLDLWILWRTVRMFLHRHEPVSLVDVPSFVALPTVNTEDGVFLWAGARGR